MSTAQVPEPEWVDFDDDFEEFAKSAQEKWSSMTAAPFIPAGVAPGNGNVLRPCKASDLDAFISPVGYSDTTHPPGINFQMFQMLPASEEYHGGLLVDPVPAVETSALPSVPPDDVSGIYEGLYDWGGTLLGCGPNSSYPDNIPVAPKMATFPLSSVVLGDTGSDGNNSYPDDDDNHPTSLATAKPKTIENDTQSETTSPAASGSGGGYNRTENNREKKERFQLICRVLGINWLENELTTLRAIIECLGRTIPVVPELTDPATKCESQARKRKERKAYFAELSKWIGFRTDHELKVLDGVLAKLTVPDDSEEQDYKPFHTFSLEG